MREVGQRVYKNRRKEGGQAGLAAGVMLQRVAPQAIEALSRIPTILLFNLQRRWLQQTIAYLTSPRLPLVLQISALSLYDSFSPPSASLSWLRRGIVRR